MLPTSRSPPDKLCLATSAAYIPLGDLVDFEAEAKRLQKELAAAEEKLAFINKKLDNPGFVNKAPEKVVQQNRDEAAKLTEKIANLRSSLENLGK